MFFKIVCEYRNASLCNEMNSTQLRFHLRWITNYGQRIACVFLRPPLEVGNINNIWTTPVSKHFGLEKIS